MATELPYERLLRESLRGELKVVNAHLPTKQKPLSDLLIEEHPHVVCQDGSTHLFRRKELEHLAGLLDIEEQKTLMLPVLIEVSSGQSEIAVRCPTEVEEKIVSRILNMPLTPRQKRIVIYRPQLAVLRKYMRTTSQYLFLPKL
jgi:uncharacterized protein (UPF0216 family)